ncbi:MAG: hypothetical protein RIC55_07180 [Pirellulaceae bacterium]
MSERENKRKRSWQYRKPLHPAWKVVISGLVLFHLSAVVIFPLAFASHGDSPSVRAAVGWFEPYGRVCHLNHGYAFFAPDPGPSHLVEYRLEFNDGRQPITGRFPDLEQHWPRLLYHRHFMLAEHLNADYRPPQPPPGATPEQLAMWKVERGRYEQHLRSLQRHLLEQYDADRVILKRLEHRIPYVNAFLYDGMRLDDERLFVVQSEVEVLEAEGAEK